MPYVRIIIESPASGAGERVRDEWLDHTPAIGRPILLPNETIIPDKVQKLPDGPVEYLVVGHPDVAPGA